ncbi:MAG: hypothetical protein R3E31_25560 [Chloroflexota bacterium]
MTYYREIGDKRGQGLVLGNLGEVALYEEDYEQARDLCQQSIDLFNDMGLPTISFQRLLAFIDLAQNRFEESWQEFWQVLQDDPAPPLILDVLTGMATVLTHRGQKQKAVSLLTFIRDHLASEQVVRERANAQLAVLSVDMAPDEFTLAQDEGIDLTMEEWLVALS